MISKRLKTIASLVDVNSKVFDVGCDHGLLSIYLSKDHEVIASDITDYSVISTRNNVAKAKANVKVIKSDGLIDLNINKEDTIILAGMGTSTILTILNKDINKLSDTIIIQANNSHELLRRSMYKLGYFIKEEIYINDNKNYEIMKFIKGKIRTNKEYFLLGPNPKQEYINIVFNMYNNMYNQITNKHFVKKIRIKKILNKINKKRNK